MLAIILLAAATPAASEFNGLLEPYLHCLRTESREPRARDDFSGEFAQGQWPIGVITSFAHAIRYCEPLRNAVLIRAHEIVQTRHPDWQSDWVERSAQTILARIELKLLQNGLALPMTSHGEVEDW